MFFPTVLPELYTRNQTFVLETYLLYKKMLETIRNNKKR